MKLTEITDPIEASKRLVELHKIWQPNIEVTVWGRGKATLFEKQQCLDTALTGKAEYPGDCDMCRWFMGARRSAEGAGPVYWGEKFKGCCALLLEIATPEVTK